MTKLFEASNLTSYFYEELNRLNKESLCPISEEKIVYSSEVLGTFLLSEKLFELREGKVKDKTLGIELLETKIMDRALAKRKLKEIGDTSLFLCGYWSKYLKEKIVGANYYYQLGVTAYYNLNFYCGEYNDTKDFFKSLSDSFNTTVGLISLMENSNPLTSEDEMSLLHQGIIISSSKLEN